jgi:hypothetical protein
MDARNMIHYQILSNSSPHVNAKPVLKWRVPSNIVILQYPFMQAVETITPLLVNVVSSFHSTQHKSQVHFQFCAHAIIWVGSIDYCFMAVALVHIVHEKDTTTFWWRSVSYMTKWVLVDGLACTTPKHIPVLFRVIWVLTLASPYCNSSVCIIKAIHEMYEHTSTLCISKS